MTAAARAPRIPEPAPEMTVAEFARCRGVTYLRTWRTITALAKADAEHGALDWLIDLGRGAHKRICLTRLEAAHPALFHRRFAQREELEEMRERVDVLEEAVTAVREVQRDEKKQRNALGGRLRAVEAQLSLVFADSRERR